MIIGKAGNPRFRPERRLIRDSPSNSDSNISPDLNTKVFVFSNSSERLEELFFGYRVEALMEISKRSSTNLWISLNNVCILVPPAELQRLLSLGVLFRP